MTAPLRPLTDGYERRFRYLRLSVTEVCNFRCTYCLPDGYRKTGPLHFLEPDEIGRLVAAFAPMGLAKVRLTGGEPSVRKDLAEIIARAATTPGIAKTCMTTNGWNLARKLDEWTGAGLTHLNVSIDSLDRAGFEAITGHDRLHAVLDGVDAALASSLKSVKVNAVLLRETAEVGFAQWTEFVRERPVSVRFIELMRTGDNKAFFEAHHASGNTVRDWLTAHGWLPAERGADDGPAVEYVHPDHAGRIGLIAPYAPGFCDSCNRLRVTARGRMRLCLFGDGGVDLRPLLQSDGDRGELQTRIREALTGKTRTHGLHQDDPGATRNLSLVGG
ncbi:GTP 3',8-cyclase MoaA [Glycocaulis sp.]